MLWIGKVTRPINGLKKPWFKKNGLRVNANVAALVIEIPKEKIWCKKILVNPEGWFSKDQNLNFKFQVSLR